ncbi:MAG: hypothetical protein Kow00105_16890 [Phycisphaeraceae bacterium]
MPLAYGLIHPVDLAFVDLPSDLEGLRIAHLSDLHVTRHARRHDRLITQLTSLRFDLALFTGDYMTRHRDAHEAAAVLRRITEAINPRLGMFGVFGNHDSATFKDLVKDIGIHWLGNGVHALPRVPIVLFSVDPLDGQGEDSTAMLLNHNLNESGVDPKQCLRLMLAHYPSWYTTAADLGVHLLLSGHTHGGQIRTPTRRSLLNACDLPLRHSTGVIRHRDTLLAISKGLGEVGYPGTRFRLFCSPHVPVYTLRRGPTLGQHTAGLTQVVSW